MEQYIGLDVSLKETHICVVDGSGEVVARGRAVTEPDRLAVAIGRLAPSPARVVLETGGLAHLALMGWYRRVAVKVFIRAQSPRRALNVFPAAASIGLGRALGFRFRSALCLALSRAVGPARHGEPCRLRIGPERFVGWPVRQARWR